MIDLSCMTNGHEMLLKYRVISSLLDIGNISPNFRKFLEEKFDEIFLLAGSILKQFIAFDAHHSNSSQLSHEILRLVSANEYKILNSLLLREDSDHEHSAILLAHAHSCAFLLYEIERSGISYSSEWNEKIIPLRLLMRDHVILYFQIVMNGGEMGKFLRIFADKSFHALTFENWINLVNLACESSADVCLFILIAADLLMFSFSSLLSKISLRLHSFRNGLS
jgi:hypothetical protein